MSKMNLLHRLALSFLLLAFASTLPAATSVSQFGITWTFNGDYTTGQYANGDYYVVAPSGLTITAISPLSIVSGGRTINGSMVNPIAGPTANQGLDANSGTFLASLNAARPGGNTLSTSNPLILPAGSSLVSAESDLTATWSNRPQLLNAAVLTVVSSAPAAGTFRPPYCGTLKPSWNKASLNYSILSSLAPVASTPTIAACAANFTRPWIEIITNYQGREMHPINNQPDYGREMAYQLGDALLRLHLNDSNASKEPLYIRLVQYGIDVYGAAQTANWWADGGHDHGRKMPMLLAGLALGDANILAYANGVGAYCGKFQEDSQTYYVDSGMETAIPYTVDGNMRSSYAPRAAAVTISNSSPAVVTWPTTTATVTISNSSPAVITWNNHGLKPDRMVKFSSTGSLPAGITAGTIYYIIPEGLGSNTFEISASKNGSAINTSSAGSGVQSGAYSHGFDAEMPIVFTTTGTLPSPLVAGQTYWVLSAGLTLNTFEISPVGTYDQVSQGTPVNTTTTGSGTHTATFSLTGIADWGVKGYWPIWGSSNWNSAYRDIVTTSIMGHVLAARLTTGAVTAWNWAPLFDYTDRAIGVNPGAHVGASNEYSGFAKQMWDAYRGTMPPPPVIVPPVVVPPDVPPVVTAPSNALLNVSTIEPTVSGNPAFSAEDTRGSVTSSASSISIPVVSGMSVGERVVLVYTSEGGAPVSSISDSAGNTYTLMKSQAAYNDPTYLTNIYSAHVATAIAPGATITVNLSSGSYSTKAWLVCKLSGCFASGQPNQTVGNSTYGTAVSASASPASAPSLLFGVVKARTSETYSGSSWTAIGAAQDSGAGRSWFLRKSATDTTAQDIGGNLSGNQVYYAMWVSFN